MILHALHKLYGRLEQDEAYEVAPEGFSLQKVSFVIVLEADGSLVQIRDHRTAEDGHRRPQIHRALGSAKPPGAGINPCFLWDNTGYLLGYKPEDSNPQRSLETFAASCEFHLALEKEINHSAFSAVCRFFESWQPERLERVAKLDALIRQQSDLEKIIHNTESSPSARKEASAQSTSLQPLLTKSRQECGPDVEKLTGIGEIGSGFGLFQTRGCHYYVHDESEIVAWWQRQQADDTGQPLRGTCLISGEKDSPIAQLHTPKIKGVKDAQGAGALIVSFNDPAYESFGKTKLQGLNAPVSTDAASKYCKALNALLSSQQHRLQVGDATTVFWTEAPTDFERTFLDFFTGRDPADEDDSSNALSQASTLLSSLQVTLRSVSRGGKPEPEIVNDSNVPFYILGLTGQAGGRIGIRFWHSSNVGDLITKLAQHYHDLAIVPQWDQNSRRPDPEFPPLWMLLRQTGREAKDVPPNLSGALIRSVLNGTPYPELLATSVLSRIRAEREITYLRAAILKGWLTRIPNTNYEIPMTYQSHKSDTAYRLGALFALLEKTQRDALGDVNAGIRDRYYSSASATPGSVFPRLMRTYGHHLAKASAGNKGYQICREREVQSVLAEPEPLDEFPSHFNLRDQGLFAIGYYHKRTDLWSKKEPSPSEESVTESPSRQAL